MFSSGISRKVTRTAHRACVLATNYILKNVSFSVKQHEKVAIVGASGSGKTTILKLLSGLYQPVKGDIKLNGL